MTAPRRVQMTRQRPWRAEHPDAVIVARPGKWGNPYRVGDTALVVVHGHGGIRPAMQAIPDAATAVRAYRQWLTETSEGREVAEGARAELAGRDLACWCPLDSPCHGDVLLALANPKETDR